MDRINYIEIAGSTYPLCYDMRASEKMLKLKSINEKSSLQEGMKYALDCLYILLQEGAAYSKLFLGNEIKLNVDREKLDVYYSVFDYQDVLSAVNETIAAGQKRTIETQKAKNAEAAQQIQEIA